MKEDYKIERVCFDCGNKQSVRKRDAAFEKADVVSLMGHRCNECNGKKFLLSYEKPDLDVDLLKLWSTDLGLFLKAQDEELLLADERYFEMILETLDSNPILDYKRNVLLDALCVLVYDNTIDESPHRNEELQNKVINELNQRKDKLKLADDWISDYIKDVVYPQLDLGTA